MENNFGSLLGLSRKANFLNYGFETVKSLVLKGEVRVILITYDISDKTKKEINYFIKDLSIQLIETEYSMEDIGVIIGKKTKIIGLKDGGLTDKILAIYNLEKKD